MLVSVSTMPAGDGIEKYVKEIESYADFIHCDVCDGIYNKTTCFNETICDKINSVSTIPIECHLMTMKPLEKAKKYIKCGANILTAQIESFNNREEILEFIKQVHVSNALVGLAIEPKTPETALMDYLSLIDIVLVMSVKTGESGQTFNQSALYKIQNLTNIRNMYQYNFKIEVDGGINETTINRLKGKGIDIVVSGSYVYSSKDKSSAISSLKL